MVRQNFISVTEAAQLLGVHRHTVRALFRRGLLKGDRIAGRLLLERAGVEELAKTYRPKPGRPRYKSQTDGGEA